MLPAQWSRPQRALVYGSLYYLILFAALVLLRPGSHKRFLAILDFWQLLPPLFAAVCTGYYGWRRPHPSRTRKLGWLMISLGCLCFTAGQALWTYYESIRSPQASFPGWADVGFLAVYPFLMAGAILLFGSLKVGGSFRLFLDSVVAAVGVGILSWYFLVQSLWYRSQVALMGKAISITCPLADVAVLFAILVLFSGTLANKSLRQSSGFLASGLGLLWFADTAFTYFSLTGMHRSGLWTDWAHSLGWMMVGLGAVVPALWGQPEPEGDNLPLQGMVMGSRTFRVPMPHLAALVAFGIVAANNYFRVGAPGLPAFLIGSGLILLVILLVVLRQVLTIMENEYLAGQIKAFNANLDGMVLRRTEEVSLLHQLTQVVNTSLVRDQVLSDAAKLTAQALPSDAVVLWLLEEDESGQRRVPRLRVQKGMDGQREVIDFLAAQTLSDQVETVHLPPADGAAGGGAGACLRAPMLWQNQVVGMLGLVRWNGKFGWNEPEMLGSIGKAVGSAYENARLYSAAVEAADRDPVTGLYNHRAIHQRLDIEFSRATRGGTALAVIMIDLNNFKLFNDHYGHFVGDQVLKRVAQVLTEECRVIDILARYGGDEFIVILPNTDGYVAWKVAERLRDRMSSEGVAHDAEGTAIPITLSLGVAAYPVDGENRHELLAAADTNLYAAKDSETGIRASSETQRTHRTMRHRDDSFGMLNAMVTAVDNKDHYTRRHSEDVTDYALWSAEELGLSEDTLRIIRIGGLLHDVGKIGVPDEVLRKPGKLTEPEYEAIKRHTLLGSLIVMGVPGMESIVDAVRSHHERWDGGGYPDGLSGESIPLLGRLIAVADAFSAMTTDRPYRMHMDWTTALDQIRDNSSSQFDPDMASAFIRAARRKLQQAEDELRRQISSGESV